MSYKRECSGRMRDGKAIMNQNDGTKMNSMEILSLKKCCQQTVMKFSPNLALPQSKQKQLVHL